jgi:hypothetical protein
MFLANFTVCIKKKSFLSVRNELLNNKNQNKTQSIKQESYRIFNLGRNLDFEASTPLFHHNQHTNPFHLDYRSALAAFAHTHTTEPRKQKKKSNVVVP